MPHIIVEYPADAHSEIEALFPKLHLALKDKETINQAAVKARAVPVAKMWVGESNQPAAAFHITLKLLPGRSDTLKKNMAETLRNTALSTLQETHPDWPVSAEVQDLHAESYCK
jgi:5-carboxymethyl-2-hydroxymuconate isomerase